MLLVPITWALARLSSERQVNRTLGCTDLDHVGTRRSRFGQSSERITPMQVIGTPGGNPGKNLRRDGAETWRHPSWSFSSQSTLLCPTRIGHALVANWRRYSYVRCQTAYFKSIIPSINLVKAAAADPCTYFASVH